MYTIYDLLVFPSPQKDFEHKRYPIYVLLIARVQISVGFAVQPVVLELQAILRQMH